MAVRRELVFDECGGASRRRRQAHVFLTAQINNLTRRAEKGIRADPLANCLFLPRGGTVQAVCLLRSLKKNTEEPLPLPLCG